MSVFHIHQFIEFRVFDPVDQAHFHLRRCRCGKFQGAIKHKPRKWMDVDQLTIPMERESIERACVHGGYSEGDEHDSRRLTQGT